MRSRSSVLPKDLASAQRRIDKWRAGNGRRRLIPEPVWTEAADLARAHGVNRVSVAMRLSYEKLRERVEAKGASAGKSKARVSKTRASKTRRGVDAVPQFVEFSAPALIPGGVSVELTDGNGRCVTIRGAGHTEVLGIVAAFYGGSPA